VFEKIAQYLPGAYDSCGKHTSMGCQVIEEFYDMLTHTQLVLAIQIAHKLAREVKDHRGTSASSQSAKVEKSITARICL